MTRRWGHPAVFWLLAAVLCAELAGLLFRRGAQNPDAALWAGLATQGLWIGLAVGVASLGEPGRWRERLGMRVPRLRLSTLLLLVVGLLALSNALNALLMWTDMREGGALGEIDAQLARARTRAPSLLLALVAIAVAPGIAEELLFRGLLQRAIARHLGSAAGVVGSAALFGLAHFDPAHSGVAFVLGLYLGAVALLAGSVWAPVLCHVVNNVLAMGTPRLGLGGLEAPPLLVVAGLGALACALLGFARWREGPPEVDPRGEHPTGALPPQPPGPG